MNRWCPVLALLVAGLLPHVSSRTGALRRELQTVTACSTATPCPKYRPYYYCTQGQAYNGCQAAMAGPFPASACLSQCLTGASANSSPSPSPSRSQSPSPSPSPSPLPSPSPNPNPSPNPSPSLSPSPSPSSAGYTACTRTGPCPTNTQYYWCQSGAANNGCQALSNGPFAAIVCSSQCLTTTGSSTATSPSPSPVNPNTRPASSPRVFRVVNKCASTVWIAALSNPMPTLMNTSWALAPGGAPLVLSVPAVSQSGRLWARTGCSDAITLPACPSNTARCPSGADYVYCSAGTAFGGCQLATAGPFAPSACSSQCVAPANADTAQSTYSFPAFSCQTGDCNGQRACGISGSSPATLFEWTFTSDGTDIYDISAVDGYNVGIKATPTGPYVQRPGQACDAPSCTMNTATCPPELQTVTLDGSTACMSICAAVYSATQRARFPVLQRMFTATTASGKMVRDLVCCSCGDNCGSTCGCDSDQCTYGCSPYVLTYPASYQTRVCRVEDWPLASNGLGYIQPFKSACPGAYSWQYDDVAGLHYCSLADYEITLCG